MNVNDTAAFGDFGEVDEEAEVQFGAAQIDIDDVSRAYIGRRGL